MSTNPKLEQLKTLGQTLAGTSNELDKLLSELASQADLKLVAAAREFVASYEDPSRGPLYVHCNRARQTLTQMAIAASNIKELADGARTLRTQCAEWSDCNRQVEHDIVLASGVFTRASEPNPDQQTEANQASVWLSNHYDELPTNEWVAATKDGLIARAASVDVVLAKVKELGIDLDDVATMFVPEAGPEIIRQ
ncbi:MAG TPA: hypothetical protein V6C81_11665 [Planktothrix sp.]